MVWIYLAESADSQSPLETMSDPSPTVKLTPIVKRFCSAEWRVVTSPPLISGTMSDHFPRLMSEDQLTSSTVASLAKTSALQDMEKVWRESEAAFIGRSIGWPKKSSPHSYSLKTCQLSFVEEDPPWFNRLPRWGMIVGGVLYPLRPLERFTAEKGGSYWPTPVANDDNKSIEAHLAMKARMKGGQRKTITSLNVAVKMWPTPDSSARGACKNLQMRGENRHHFTIQDAVNSGKLNPTWVEWLMGYPAGWSELSAWAMQWYLLSVKKRSKSLRALRNKSQL